MGNYKPKFEIRIYWSPSEKCYFAAIPELWGCGQAGKSPQGALNKLLPLIPVYVELAGMGNLDLPTAHIKTIQVWEGPLPVKPTAPRPSEPTPAETAPEPPEQPSDVAVQLTAGEDRVTAGDPPTQPQEPQSSI